MLALGGDVSRGRVSALHPELFEVELALDLAQGLVVDLAVDPAAR